MMTDFRGRDINRLKQMVQSGDMYIWRRVKNRTVQVRGPPMEFEKLRDGDRVSNSMHQHEKPVRAAPINTIFEDDRVLVVDKPAGIPVHPNPGHVKNTIVEMVRSQKGLSSLHLMYRLDKAVSGVLIMAKTRASYKQLLRQIESKKGVLKKYVARVRGKFPDECECNDDVVEIDPQKHYRLGGVSHAKTAHTKFSRLSYSPELDESLVICELDTGRRHQIRVHLRNLGHPIVNDPLYGESQILGEAIKSRPDSAWFAKIRERAERELKDLTSPGECAVCGFPNHVDPRPEDLVIYLHAQEYSVEGSWKYTAELPDWAKF
ncbi:hypothetical protein OGAPHI_005713 [Ogataea philodendri]|uniref:Pseudouridine synthase n=1 Tax=Ogataea philodendri TaxID=1378263 RepID=A0A9P8T1E8_9ASCO|nr:uncharacterized protein OGAPHI_005713 [Ogataea philodendri]KAH3662461.1 hypothetical protein OGAPHI_005713 [Ogataea philodendri]